MKKGKGALRFAVIGSPVEHSRSPAMHRAAFAALGMPHTYEKLETFEADLPRRVQELRDGTFAGLNVTIPHKGRVLELVDELSPSVRAMGAANTLVRTPDGLVVAHNTDAPALRQELEALGDTAGLGAPREGAMEHAPFRERSVVVLGTGGAARAAVVALASLGAARIIVRARSSEHAASLGEVVPTATLEVQPLAAPDREPEDLAAIVQATSCGMQGGPPGEPVADAVAWASVPSDAIAYDVVYVPRDTPFLQRARQRGIVCDDGLGMLARQGALAFQLWLGVVPPLDVMRAALLDQRP